MSQLNVDVLEDGRRTLKIDGGPVATEITDPQALLHLHSWNGRVFASGLFTMYDTHGLPLEDSIIQCRQRGWEPCLHDFVACAIRAGWSREKAERFVETAVRDADVAEART